ncbi:MAG: hypothetical protein HOO97_06190 [Sideroxydans sp.]|nr:hypothetical protein [Sideroxydans sp.]
MLKTKIQLFAAALITSLLVACGAGGKSTAATPVTPTPTPAAPSASLGLTMTPPFSGLSTFANIAPMIAGSQFIYMKGTDIVTITYYPATSTVPANLYILFNQGAVTSGLNAPRLGSAGYICMEGANSSNFPLCSSLGVSFDKVAGKVSFTNTPMSATGSTTTLYTMTGTLTFTPF